MINTKILRLGEVPRTTGQRVLVLLPTQQKSKFSLSLVCKFLMEGFKFKTKLQEARFSTSQRWRISVPLFMGSLGPGNTQESGQGLHLFFSGAYLIESFLRLQLAHMETVEP